MLQNVTVSFSCNRQWNNSKVMSLSDFLGQNVDTTEEERAS